MPVKEVSENKELVPHESTRDSGNELAIIRFEKEKNVLVEKWGGGDICDLTKKPRTVEVIYECYPQYIEGIIDLKELSTCNYQMIINSVKLCENPFYTEKKRYITYPINCVEVVKEEDLSRKQKEAEDKKKRQELKLQELEDKAKNPKIIQLDTNKFESLNNLFNNKKGDSVLNLLTELSRLYGSKENKLENKIKDKENSNNEDGEIELDLSKFFGFSREEEEDGDNQGLDQDQIKNLFSYGLKETMELLKQETRKNKEESELDEE
ncbi:hypothetical protein K502DRAFT_326739 [Neoconidiobolus thromboides FSU 785]|nr:hypothetical protein K502DRAFT_326739 [Neoconidiobolus thromboides FSU 785]